MGTFDTPAAPLCAQAQAVPHLPAAAEANRATGAPAVVPAIVVGRGPTGLGTLRALVLAGIPAYVACPQDDLVTRSRWYRPVPGLPWDGSVGPHALDALRAMPLEQAVLIPGRDDAALWLADLPADLAARFRVSSSPAASLAVLQDKSRFARHLAGTTMPHPRTFAIASARDIDAVPFEQLDRVFIKPADSQQFSQATGAKGIWARDRAQFEAIWRPLDDQGFKVIAQEYVPGAASDHYFIDGFRDRTGALTGLFARRRRRIYPADFGNSSCSQSVPLAHLGTAVPELAKLLAGLRYRGIFSAEFKRDARSGQLRILEINTRAWWYVEFAARCGVNVCAMAWQDALERPVERGASVYPVGASCVNLDGDIKAVWAAGRADGGGLRAVLRAVPAWLRSTCHVFRWDDPGPAAGVLWQRLRRRLARPPAVAATATSTMAPASTAASDRAGPVRGRRAA